MCDIIELRKEERNLNAKASKAKCSFRLSLAATSAFCGLFQDICLDSTGFVLKAVVHAVWCQGNYTNRARLSVN